MWLVIRLINRTRTSHGTPKYRFVMRFTNKDIITQIVSTSIAGDMILTSAYAHELPDMGFDALLEQQPGALKGALDGGLDIPHLTRDFAGFNKENKRLDAGGSPKYVYGGHVALYDDA
ncbi:hypothetical protein IFM89_020687 [Coptis chinensis]|uniref:Uncharacterized protein n=1 Tax=Coptis chinensis TaxID=261450 RepID=A0A835LVW2_9MAGN|nr:hypothetical protein IFM89_020687 [Coptis chinensis]